jgi:uncharacterized protein
MLVHDDWLLTPHRAAVHRPTATAVVADLHLGYDLARRRRGEAVPASSLDETCAALTPLLTTYVVRSLVIAGDVCEDAAGIGLIGELIAWLDRAGVRLAGIVPGNHDRVLRKRPERLPICAEGLRLGGWHIVHGDGKLPHGRVIHGHYHPCLRWQGHAAPCYLIGERRIVLPAFTADAAGVNVLVQPQWRGYRCCIIAGQRVLDFGAVETLRARLTRSASKSPRATTRGPRGV